MKSRENFADDGHLQLALREVSAMVGTGRFWITIAAASIVLAIAAPFRTGETLSFGELLAYWSLIALSAFLLAIIVSKVLGYWLEGMGVPEVPAWLVAGMVSGLPIAALVMAINAVAFSGSATANQPVWIFILQCIGISTAIVMVFLVLGGNKTNAKPTMPLAKATHNPKLTERLNPRTGTDIISLRAQDHYVEVTTPRGSELVLIRLADAEAEMGDIQGGRIHRSWWVAKHHVTALKRDGERVSLILSNGQSVPVSRSKLKLAKQLVDNATNG